MSKALLASLGITKETPVVAGLENEGHTSAVSTHASARAFEESYGEVAAAGFEVQQAEQSVELVQNYQKRIETLHAALAANVKEGLTQREAAIAEKLVADLNADLPEELQADFPANESFGSTALAADQTELGLEALSAQAKKFWETVKEQINRLIQALQNWWNKFFGNGERLVKWAEAVEKKADGFEPKDEKKKIKLNAKLLSEGATPVSEGNIAAKFEAFAATISAVESEGKLAKDVIEACIDAAGKEGNDIKTAFEGPVAAAQKAMGETKSPAEDGKFIGGKYIVANKENNTRSVKESEAKTKEDVEITIVKPADCGKIAKAAMMVGEKIIDLREKRKDVVKANDKVKKALTDLSKAEGDDDNKSIKSDIKALGRALQKAVSAANGGVASAWSAHLVTVSRAALQTAESSLA